MQPGLNGKKGLVVGIANASSIAWGCANAFHETGAELAVTYLNDKAEKHVRPLAERLQSPIIQPLDVRSDEQMDALFYRITQEWGKLDFLLHSIAFAPKEDLQGRVSDCSRAGFLEAMDISCYSFLRMAHYARTLMNDGGALLTVSYYGAEKVIPHYNIMGPVKAALECSVRYLAAELGAQHIRVNALSPGPVLTRAASGIAGFSDLLEEAGMKAPAGRIVSIEEIGAYARFLVSDEARNITGNIAYIDAGLNVLGVG